MATVAKQPPPVRSLAAARNASARRIDAAAVQPFGEELVHRPQLVRRLSETRLHRLAVITGPAGYGKTTLLADWAAQDERPFAWITAAREDYDRDGLSDAFADALEQIGICNLNEGGAGFVLVLDDAHNVRADVLRDVVTATLARLPRTSQIALSSRTTPAIGLGKLRALRVLTEVTAGDLAMSPGEAAALLRGAGVDPDFATVQRLVAETEGWPVGLYLAALSLRAQAYDPSGEAGFTGADHLITQYVEDEFLATLRPGLRTFLVRASVLDRLSGEVCDAVLASSGSARKLEQLAASNLPLQPADHSHDSYRLHGLLRQSLQAELRRREPKLLASLHRQASVWYEQHGDLERTIEHAVAAGDVARAGDLLWENLLRYLSDGRVGELERLIALFTDQQIAACPQLALTAAHSHLAAGNLELALYLSRAAIDTERRPAAPRPRTDDQLVGASAIIEAWAAADGIKGMMEQATRAAGLLSGCSGWETSTWFLRGVAARLAGDREGAGELFAQGADRGALSAPHVAALCLAQLASIAIESGDGESASELAQRALRTTERCRLSGHPVWASVLAVSAIVAAQEGRIDDASTYVRRCDALVDHLDRFAPWYQAQLRILLAQALTATTDVTHARELLASASRLARRTHDAVAFPIWLDLAWGEIDARAETAVAGSSSLTRAELRVLRFLPTHYSFGEIAQRLHVSSNTVKTQVHAIYRKLGASSRSEAVEIASRAGLVFP